MYRIFLTCLVALVILQNLPGQEIQSVAGKLPAAKEAFAENANLKEAAFNEAFYNRRQQRLREHYRVVPVDPLPANRQGEAAPLPPPPTPQPKVQGEASVGVNLVQNRALTDLETANATSTVCEPSLAVRGQEILMTGNWFASFSRDGGASFSYRNPYTIFPAIVGRDFCCDQVAYYVKDHDLMVWFLQYVNNGTGNTIRVAVAHGDDIAAERWRYYDFTPQDVGNWAGEWFDFPDIAASNGNLFITTNSFDTSDQFKRSVVLRLPLTELKTYAALNYQHYDRTDVGSLRLTQGARDTMYVGTHANTGTLRVFSWADAAATISLKDFTVQPWVRGGASSPGGSGLDWLGGVDGRITAAWLTGGSPGFAWTSAQGGSFAKPHVRAALLDWTAGTTTRQPHIWSAAIAYAYPAAAVNSDSRIGVSLFYGSATTAPSHTVGVLKPDFNWGLQATDIGSHFPPTNRWGDYLSVRLNGQNQARFACTGFTLAGPQRTDIVARLVQYDIVPVSESSPILPKAMPGATTLPKGQSELFVMGRMAPLAPAADPKGKFDPQRRGIAANRVQMMAALPMAAAIKPTVVLLPKDANLEVHKKLTALPDAASFFFDPPETVCLPDERAQALNTTQDPWNKNCQLVITFENGDQAIGTGWFAGPRLIVTAGHCVHEGEGGKFFKTVEVIPGMHGASRPFGSKVSSQFRASKAWKDNGTMAADYGAIILPEPFDAAEGVLPGAYPLHIISDADLNQRTLTISGYPADKAFGTQWFHSGEVLTIQPKRLLYSIDTFGGHSGSALVSKVNDAVVAVGIHNYGGCPNKCTRITAEVKTDLDAWLLESKGSVVPKP